MMASGNSAFSRSWVMFHINQPPAPESQPFDQDFTPRPTIAWANIHFQDPFFLSGDMHVGLKR